MSEDWETDDWHAPIASLNISDENNTSQTEERPMFDDEDYDASKPPQMRPIGLSVTSKQNTKTDLTLLAQNAVPIFKNSKIKTGVMVRIDPEYGRMRIFNNSNRGGLNLNTLYEVKDLTSYLKSAIEHYSSAKKATTTSANKKQLKLLTEAVDKVNGAIHTHELAYRRQQLDSTRELLEIARIQKARLEAEISLCVTVDINEQKNDCVKLKQTAQSVLRILSGKDTSRASSLHYKLKKAVNPERYQRELDEFAESQRRAIVLEEEKRERDRERRRINGFIGKFSQFDKENFMKLKELLSYDPNAEIPYRLRKYYDAVVTNPYLSFTHEFQQTGSSVQQIKMSADREYRANFPTMVPSQQYNAWSQPLGTRTEEKPKITGAWAKQLDKEALAKLPDPEPVKKPVATHVDSWEDQCESEDESFDNDQYLASDSDEDWN